jgi:Trk K+ transport system NAD-binding subunit
MAAGFLLAAHLGLVIAASSVGLELGAITQGANSSFIIMVIITCFASPYFYNQINPKKAFTEGGTIIVGGSSIGVLLSRRLKLLGKSCVIIEHDQSRFSELSKSGIETIHGDGREPELYKQLSLNPSSYVVVLTGNDEANLEICGMIRKELHHERIISVPGSTKMEDQLHLLGVEILDATRVVASTIENLILRPGTYHSLIQTYENYTVEDITVINSSIDGKTVMELPLHHDCMLMLLARGNEKQVPHGSTYIKQGDVLTVFGTSDAISELGDLLRSVNGNGPVVK